MSTTQRLEFESPHFLQSLFGNDVGLLKRMEEAFLVRLTTRDAWVKIEGEEPAIEKAREVFRRLEKVRRDGTEIGKHVFRLAVESVSGDDDASLDDVVELRLLGSAGKPAVGPRTRGQARYLRAIHDDVYVFGIGPAGTGKTYLAMAMAVSALKEGSVGRIVLTRPAVEAGEALGFLPGDLTEKIFPYLRPLYDALYDMLDPEEVEKYINRGMIEIAPLAYMRGRTLNRAFIILDEAQNTTREQMLMFLTRLGEESRCVITGDITQIDLKAPRTSGLVEATKVLDGVAGIRFVYLEKDDVIRHEVVQNIIEAYSRNRESNDAPRGGA